MPRAPCTRHRFINILREAIQTLYGNVFVSETCYSCVNLVSGVAWRKTWRHWLQKTCVHQTLFLRNYWGFSSCFTGIIVSGPSCSSWKERINVLWVIYDIPWCRFFYCSILIIMYQCYDFVKKKRQICNYVIIDEYFLVWFIAYQEIIKKCVDLCQFINVYENTFCLTSYQAKFLLCLLSADMGWLWYVWWPWRNA